MDYKSIIYSQDENGVVELTLNRPEKRNSMNGVMFWEIHKALQRMSQDDSVKCCLLTGAGDHAFPVELTSGVEEIWKRC